MIYKAWMGTLRVKHHLSMHSIIRTSSKDKQFIKVHPPCFHLFVSKLQQGRAFNEYETLLILLDCSRTGQTAKVFERVLGVALNNLEKINSLLSLMNVANSMYVYDHKNQEDCKKLTRRTF